MSTSWVVMKFGGTSVSTEARWRSIAEHLGQRVSAGQRPLVVVSALGGITNTLEGFVQDPEQHARTAVIAADIITTHQSLLGQFGLTASDRLAGAFAQLESVLQAVAENPASVQAQALCLAQGECLSSALGEQVLTHLGHQTHWLDARSVLTAEPGGTHHPRRAYLSASCTFDRCSALEEKLTGKQGVWITQGFVGANEAGETVVLGRGGSDTSAAYLGAKLGADRVEIWTDVPGMFSANPHQIPAARLLQVLSYREAQEIASTGAKVLHPRCIEPLRQASIPLHVCQTSRSDIEGTVVSDHAKDFGAQVKAIAYRTGITLITMDTVGMWQQVGFLSEAFAAFGKHGLSIDLISTSESTVTVSLDAAEQLLDRSTIDDLVVDLERLCDVTLFEGAASVSLVGRGIRTILHRLAPALEVFEERRIHLVSQSANDLNLTFVVDEPYAEQLVRQLHHELIGAHVPAEELFGPSWESLFSEEPTHSQGPVPWWITKRDRLLELCQTRLAAFAYDRDSIRQAANQLLTVKGLGRVLYAVKANPNAQVLKLVHEAGLGFECVSVMEVEHVLATLPGLTPDQILFTPNFAPREEYLRGFELGVHVTLDNLFPLRQWPEVFKHRPLFVRLDLGKGEGHHKKVRTAGTGSKFGVPLAELDELRTALAQTGATVVGLHSHAGSGVNDPDNWRRTAKTLLAIADGFPEVRVIDLGGGLGVAEKPGESGLDLADFSTMISDTLPEDGPECWIEPGRFLIARAGVLLAQVTQLKGKGETQYVGVATGMNSLIRPALYGAYHEIVNLTQLEQPRTQLANVVGPICETGDILGLDRLLPVCHEGDVLLIANAGAYGAAMSSRYNLREPAEELFV